MNSVVLAIAAAVIAWVLVGAIKRLALRHQLLDIPNERSSHERPTPRGGGLAIVVVTLAGVLLVGLLQGPPGGWPVVAAYVVGAAATATVSWLDDVRSLSNRVRFAVHVAAAAVLLFACGGVDRIVLPMVGEIAIPSWIAVPVTLIWIVGLTNAYNFMDGIDGIAGSQAVVAGIAWFALGGIAGEPFVGTLGLLIAATSVGFLAHNWPPAGIFMGDVGSAFLGYSFAALVVVGGDRQPQLVLPGILLVWPFVFDTTLTLIRRARAGENIFAAHRSHLYQRLNIAGFSHRWVTALYAVLALVGAAAAYVVAEDAAAGGLAALLVVSAAAVGLVLFVQFQQRRSAAASRSG